VGDEQRIHVAGDAGGVVGQCHCRPANDEDIGDRATPDQSLAKGCEGSLKLYAVEKDAPRLGHAASRSVAER